MGLIGKGAEADLLSGKFLKQDVVVKERREKRYRIKEIDIPLRRKRTRIEAKLLIAAKRAGVKVPVIYELGEFSISMNRIEGKLLRDAQVTSALLNTAGIFLARLHNSNIIHGDYTTANLMIDSRGALHVIDFGLGSFSKDLEDKAVDVLLFKKSLWDRRQFRAFLIGYKKESREFEKIMRQLAEVEKRGRYVLRAIQE